ncbi:uncharacterized protein SPPG_07498 [Spizellomyces punctatus DAOM BR117]|uniref:Uncharacterized protein n=1 Tax=Spizellomyces punctatus (strain DAOM BR117) TaxID=645134 RepID=A0A0L0H8X5_SPIPD|nr:uncharacterized protein SPPG_07498 [Spizellomyces punctatus DAOM BR117]KNC97103.1 hypothetical protein SPPG_07498 [Spizellomyces punctatus DAOM BR117]|eukprot:XP_016605143.1 hypothetical protein SPPG_07498 [Spizellomyces punctatus DAOM BR117]
MLSLFALADRKVSPSTRGKRTKPKSSTSPPERLRSDDSITPTRRRRARPAIDPIVLANLSHRKLQTERHRASCDMHRVVLIQNLLKRVYRTWSGLMGRPVKVLSAGNVFDDIASERPVRALAGLGGIGRRGKMRSSSARMADISKRALIRTKKLVTDDKTANPRDSGYSSDSSSDEETEQLPNAKQSTPRILHPGRTVKKKPDEDEDDEIPLGNLPFAQSGPKPVISQPPPRITGASPAHQSTSRPVAVTSAPTLRARRAPTAQKSSLRIVSTSLESDDSLDAPPKPAPMSAVRPKPSMTLIEKMELQEKSRLATLQKEVKEDQSNLPKEQPNKGDGRESEPIHQERPMLQDCSKPLISDPNQHPIPPPRRSSISDLTRLETHTPPKPSAKTNESADTNRAVHHMQPVPPAPPVSFKPSTIAPRKRRSLGLLKTALLRRAKPSSTPALNVLFIATAVESGEWKTRSEDRSPTLPTTPKYEFIPRTDFQSEPNLTTALEPLEPEVSYNLPISATLEEPESPSSPSRYSIDSIETYVSHMSRVTIATIDLDFDAMSFEEEVFQQFTMSTMDADKGITNLGSAIVRERNLDEPNADIGFLETAFDLGWEIRL